MANWIYKNKKYKTIPLPKGIISRLSIVYVPKWDKCFELLTLGMHGNGSKEKLVFEMFIQKRFVG